MHINDLDLNLLRLFDAVWRARNVSRAAEMLGLTQPATSHGLMRLRRTMGDVLFIRASGGVRPTPRAEELARVVGAALSMLEAAVSGKDTFDPRTSRRTFRMHMSDIGEVLLLPTLMARMRERAPRVCVETLYLAPATIGPALDEGRLDLAFGYLPQVRDTQSEVLLQDRYVALVRRTHPFADPALQPAARLQALRTLDFVAVRTHAQTERILQLLHLEEQLRLKVEHFTALPAIVRMTDLVAILPRNIARMFPQEEYAWVDPDFPTQEFSVSQYWSRRHEAEAGNRWLRALSRELLGA